MVDDVFRSYRNNDPVAGDGSEPRGGKGDLLAELARLTGKGDRGIRSDGSEQTAISAVAAAHSATNTRAPAAKPSTAAAR
jgi:hypothetical protein